ncbi:MAG TPA: uracil-DNA glycosylase family protein [Magnetospirillum sp.]|jgi:uracil-DNA glycosylase|nr:uracil-DNA glycosylase family protein [Magnetospirillum sp.]
MPEDFDAILARARACTLCAPFLPLGPRPILRARPTARLLIVGQAPGTKVHETGIPWNDRSGDRLREWLEMERDVFYDESRIAIVPAGLCYPGRAANGGDLPPRPECAPLWHPVILPLLTEIRLTLAVGIYAQAALLGAKRRASLTETVAAWRDHLPGTVPLPHPSWRTTAWQRKNPWFDAELLPELRRRVHAALA